MSTVVLVVLGAATSAVASITRPFTDGADVVVSLVLVSAVLAMWRQRSAALNNIPMLSRCDATSAPFSRLMPWVIAVVVALGWELFCLFSLPRSSHPTISSMLDAADGSHLGRALAFASWLVLGWYVVTR
jgi:hypothetical protein